MNRIQICDKPQEHALVPQVRKTQSQQLLLSHDPDAVACTYFSPIHYEPNYAYPLVIWLHGSGATERQIRAVMPLMSLRNYVGVALRGTHELVSPDGKTGYTWDQSLDGIGTAAANVASAVELTRSKFHVDPRRVFLVGCDAGGTMAIRLAMMAPERFSGVVSLGGCLPKNHTPLRNITRTRALPVLMAQCRDDVVYGTNALCCDLRLLHSAGIQITVRQYPGTDYIVRQQLSDANAWIMEHVTGDCSTSEAQPTRRRTDSPN